MHPNNRQKTDILFQDFEEILNNLKVFVCGSNRTMSSRYPHRASEQVRYINISVGEKFDWSITYTKIDRSLDVFFSYPYEGQKYLYIFSFNSPPRDANTSLHKYMKKHLRDPPIPVGGDYDTCSEFVYLTDVLLPGYDDRIPKCSISVDEGSIYFSKLAPSGTNRTSYNIVRDGFVVV